MSHNSTLLKVFICCGMKFEKNILFTLLLLACSDSLIGQNLNLYLGPEQSFCADDINDQKEMSAIASGGAEPYPCRWYSLHSNIQASSFLSDSTVQNPYITSATIGTQDPFTSKWIQLKLEVEASLGEIVYEVTSVLACGRRDFIGCPTVFSSVGDTIVFIAGPYTSCPVTVQWSSDIDVNIVILSYS